MAQYDDSIRINAEFQTKDAEKELKKLQGSIEKTAEKITLLRSKMNALKDVEIPTQEYKEIQAQIEKTKCKINELKAQQERFLATGGNQSSTTYRRMQYDLEQLRRSLPNLECDLQYLVDTGEAFTLGSDTQQYAKMARDMQKLNEKMESDTARQSELQSALVAEEQRLADIKDNATVSDQNIIDKLERRSQLLAKLKDMENAGVGLGYKDYEELQAELFKINEGLNEYKNNLAKAPEKFSRMKDLAKKAFNAIHAGLSVVGKIGKTAFSGLMNGAKNVFSKISGFVKEGIESFLGIDAILSEVKKGFENFEGYSDGYAQNLQNMRDAMTTLGNQCAAAFAPLVQMAIPWMNELVNVITAAMAYVAQFLAVLSGKSTFTKAAQIQNKYNKSLGSTAKAAEKARGALAKFDDLDVWQKAEDSSENGDAGDASDKKGMFEEIPVDQKAFSWVEGIYARFKELKALLSQGFWNGLGDLEDRCQSIIGSISPIKESLKKIFIDPAVIGAADSWMQTIVLSLGSLTGSVASMGLTIAAGLLGGISVYLQENEGRIKDSLTSMFNIGEEVNRMFSELFAFVAYEFEVFASEDGEQLTANLTGILMNGFMGAMELGGKLARDLLGILIIPFTENKEEFRTALQGFLGVLSEVAGTVKEGLDETFDKLNEVYDQHFKPFFDSIRDGLSDSIGKILEVWNTHIQPILDSWAEKFDILWSEHIQPMLNNFLELIGYAADFLKLVWEEGLKPQLDWIITVLGPAIGDICDFIYSVVVTAITLIADHINGIIKIVKGVIDILVGIVHGDWEKVWSGFSSVIEGVKTMAKGTVNSLIGIVEVLANAVISVVNLMIRALNDLATIKNPFTGEIVWSLDIPEINKISIPRLATGAVIRGGNPFMAVLGDQPAGVTNIETPLPTMVEAFKQAVNEIGGAGSRRIPVNINLNYDGETFARLSIPDILGELGRQGYNVDILGVT